MNRDEALARVGQLIKFNPRDGRQTWVHAELMEVGRDQLRIKPAHASSPKWVPLAACKCWHARDAQTGLTAQTIEREVVKSAAVAAVPRDLAATNGYRRHPRTKFIDYPQPIAFDPENTIAEKVLRSDAGESVVARWCDDNTMVDLEVMKKRIDANYGRCLQCDKMPLQSLNSDGLCEQCSDDPKTTACILCDAPAEHLDDEGLCDQCSAEYNRKAAETPQQFIPERDENNVNISMVNLPAPPAAPDAPTAEIVRKEVWYVVDLEGRSFFNGLRFVEVSDPAGLGVARQYSRSQDAHRARTQAARSRSLTRTFVIEQAQAEALILSQADHTDSHAHEIVATPSPRIESSIEQLITNLTLARARAKDLRQQLDAAEFEVEVAADAIRQYKKRVDDALAGII